MEGTVELEVKRMAKVDGRGTLKAFCDVALGGQYVIKGLKVVEGKKGIFVSMPREQGRDGNWYDTFLPVTKQAHQQLTDTVLAAYQAEEPSLA
jgi:stage V sporulation protein G